MVSYIVHLTKSVILYIDAHHRGEKEERLSAVSSCESKLL